MAQITLQQAKDWLRVDFDDDDEIIEELILSAQNWIESYTSHCISQRTLRIKGDGCSKTIYLYPIRDIPQNIKYKEYSLFTEFYTVRNEDFDVLVGYDSISEVPRQLISACKKLIVFLYEQRDSYAVELPNDVQILVNQLRRAIAVV